MAYRSRRAPARRRTPARSTRRSYSRSSSRSAPRARSGGRSRASGSRNIRIEVVTVPATPVARPSEFGVLQQSAGKPRTRQF